MRVDVYSFISRNQNVSVSYVSDLAAGTPIYIY